MILMRKPNEPILLFVHIPRAGGTSLWSALRLIYGRRLRRIKGRGLDHTYADVCRILQNKPHSYDVVGGHIPFGISPHSDRPIQYLTVLRDPTEVMLSRYFRRFRPDVQARKQRRGETPPQPLPGEGDAKPVATVVRSLSGNPMTRIVSGMDRRNGVKVREISRRHLQIAKANLRESLFGIVEHYEESMSLLAADLHWPDIPILEKRNAGPNRPPRYDTEIYEIGRERFPLDYELYDFAQNLFVERRQSLLGTKGGVSEAC